MCIGPLAACEVQQPFRWLLSGIIERQQLAGSTLSAWRSKAAVAKNVVEANGRLLALLRTHRPRHQLPFVRPTTWTFD